jgi:hypothetical protein
MFERSWRGTLPDAIQGLEKMLAELETEGWRRGDIVWPWHLHGVLCGSLWEL